MVRAKENHHQIDGSFKPGSSLSMLPNPPSLTLLVNPLQLMRTLNVLKLNDLILAFLNFSSVSVTSK